MSQISDLLSVNCIECDLQVRSKKKVLENISDILVRNRPDLNSVDVFSCLLDREKLGSTGIGYGVAIPHGRLKDEATAIGAFVRLAEGVTFDAIDGEPVDLFFALLVPEKSTKEHLEILSTLAKMFSDQSFCQQLRLLKDNDELYRALTQIDVK